jgi:hypothetical protein
MSRAETAADPIRCGAVTVTVRRAATPHKLVGSSWEARGKLVSRLTVYIRSPRHGSESTDPFSIIIRCPVECCWYVGMLYEYARESGAGCIGDYGVYCVLGLLSLRCRVLQSQPRKFDVPISNRPISRFPERPAPISWPPDHRSPTIS